MTIEVVVTDSGEVEITGSGYRPVGELLVGGEPIDDEALLEEVRAVLVGGSLANDASLREVDGEWTINGDPTEAAFVDAEAKLGLTAVREQSLERIGEVPYNSERMVMQILEVDATEGDAVSDGSKGVTEVLLDRRTHERVGKAEVGRGARGE